MYLDERDSRHGYAIDAAYQIMTAARTAPKAKGIDIIEIIVISDNSLQALSAEMMKVGEELDSDFIKRDAHNILKAEALILIGTHMRPMNLNCGYCGYQECKLKPNTIPCAINNTDVGIALGSAANMAARLNIDTRIMFSAGWVASKIKLIPDCNQIFALPLSISSKNPFFDRRTQDEQAK